MTNLQRLEASCIKRLSGPSTETPREREEMALMESMDSMDELTDEEREIARRYFRVFRTIFGLGNAR